MTPTIGRIVHYTLTNEDAEAINRRRSDFDRKNAGNTGYVAHVGNYAQAGEAYPAMVVRMFGNASGDLVNLQVHLDGNDTYWATSRPEGTEPGTWAWPERVG